MSQLPIACTLTPAELQAHKDDLLPGLLGRAAEAQRLSDGLEARFETAPDLLLQVARVIEAERKCCRFFRFELTVEPDGGPIRLRITGPEGTAELLDSLLEL